MTLRRRGAVEQTDWHRLEEDRFVGRVAAALEELVRSRKIPALVVVAPPHTLADLRRDLHPDVKQRIVAEINKDLTNHPVAEIDVLHIHEVALVETADLLERRAAH